MVTDTSDWNAPFMLIFPAGTCDGQHGQYPAAEISTYAGLAMKSGILKSTFSVGTPARTFEVQLDTGSQYPGAPKFTCAAQSLRPKFPDPVVALALLHPTNARGSNATCLLASVVL